MPDSSVMAKEPAPPKNKVALLGGGEHLPKGDTDDPQRRGALCKDKIASNPGQEAAVGKTCLAGHAIPGTQHRAQHVWGHRVVKL